MATITQDKMEFVVVLARELPEHSVGYVLRLARGLFRHGATYSRLAEADCNRGLSASERDRQEKIEQSVTALLTGTGIAPRFNRDPRGATIKLLLPSGRYNSFGGAEEGFCVPGS